jgi:hypothetical protein
LKAYTEPGPGDKVTAFFFRILPKFGPLSVFDFHAPTLQTEQLFAESLKATIEAYNARLRAVREDHYDPPDIDLDTGRPTQPGEYRACDRAYARLLHKLRRAHFAGVTPALRDNILAFYAESANNHTHKRPAKWRQVSRDLAALKAACGQARNGTSRCTVNSRRQELRQARDVTTQDTTSDTVWRCGF